MERKRVSPLYILIGTISDYKMLIFILISIGKLESNWRYLVLGGIIVLNVIFKYLTYRNTFYEIVDDVIIYKKGIFTKNEKYINLSNIQNVDTTQTFLYQLLNLVSLDINIMTETVKLEPLSRKDANALLAIINKREVVVNNEEVELEVESKEEVTTESKNICLKLGTKDLILLAIVKSRIIITLAALFALYDEVADLLRAVTNIEISNYVDNYKNSVFESINTIIFFVLTFLVFLFVISFISTIVKFYNFTLENKDDKLILRYGLFVKKSLVIRKERIQKVSLEEPLRYRFLKLASVRISTLTGNIMEDISSNGVELIPISKKSFSEKFIREILEIDIEKYENEHYEKINQKAKTIMIRWTFFNNFLALAVSLVVLYFLPFFEDKKEILMYSLIALITTTLILGICSDIFKYKNTSISLSENMIIDNYTSFLTKGKSYLKPVKVGNIRADSNIFLKKHNLCHISVNTLGEIFGGIKINYFDKNYVTTLENYLLKQGEESYE